MSIPLDFISTHSYAGGDHDVNSVSSIVSQVGAARQAAGGLPNLITEWGGSWRHGNTVLGGGGSSNPDAIGNATAGVCHDDYTAASFIVAVADQAQGLAEVMSYWAVTDVFEEAGFPAANSSFYGNFGVINTYGIPKPAYRAFQLLHESGALRLNTTFSGAPPCVATAGAIATTPADGQLHLLLYSQASWEDPIEPFCEFDVVINCSYCDDSLEGTVRRIDARHANPLQHWIDLGMPQYPTKSENAAIFEASALVPERLPVTSVAKGVSFTVGLPAQGVAAVSLPLRQHELFI